MNEIVEFHKDDFYFTTDSNKIDIDAVCSLLAQSYWANTRKKEIIIKSIENSLCFSLFNKDRQIGLLRVITDYATFAYLCDVIIDENYRHKGLGKWCLECVFKYPGLQDLRRWCLVTKDADELYRRFGFNEINNSKKFMERLRD